MKGDVGEMGMKGVKGRSGIQGEKGVQGGPGPPGDAGLRGDPGDVVSYSMTKWCSELLEVGLFSGDEGTDGLFRK